MNMWENGGEDKELTVAGVLGKAANSMGGRSNSTPATTEKRESTQNDWDRGVFAVVIWYGTLFNEA